MTMTATITPPRKPASTNGKSGLEASAAGEDGGGTSGSLALCPAFAPMSRGAKADGITGSAGVGRSPAAFEEILSGVTGGGVWPALAFSVVLADDAVAADVASEVGFRPIP